MSVRSEIILGSRNTENILISDKTAVASGNGRGGHPVGREALLGVEGQGLAFVVGRTAVAIIAEARARLLVVVEGLGYPLEGGRGSRSARSPPVISIRLGSRGAGAGLLSKLRTVQSEACRLAVGVVSFAVV